MSTRHRIVNNLFIDMGVESASERLIEIYEVKTSTARSDVYTAIGQLMVHGPQRCKKVIVLPEKDALVADLREALGRHHIGLLRYKRKGRRWVIVEDAGSERI